MKKILFPQVWTLPTLTLLLLSLFFNSSAQIPTHYYDSALYKSEYTLKTALFHIITAHTMRTYDQIWTDFASTDVDENGKMIDIYAGCDFTYPANQCSSSGTTGQCICYNREHSFPKSWFFEDYPMYTDLFHLYPTEGYTNSRRNNNPYGEVSAPIYTSPNGGKLGPCTIEGFSGTAFEPIDEYKGDLARTYFYMATCYENKVEWWNSPMTDSNRHQVFKPWAKQMLLKWHLQDPVSEKELKRNEAIYQIQKNRNPFIDYPELVSKIWGNDPRLFSGKAEKPFDPDETSTLYIDYELQDGQGKIVKSGSLPVEEAR